ncbi:hypothetical protein LIA77_00467 [Sarocladium implicatum]|nr:hypothetical protein LIA77_00467 [Sarocladium implicatum]
MKGGECTEPGTRNVENSTTTCNKMRHKERGERQATFTSTWWELAADFMVALSAAPRAATSKLAGWMHYGRALWAAVGADGAPADLLSRPPSASVTRQVQSLWVATPALRSTGLHGWLITASAVQCQRQSQHRMCW